MDMKVANTVDLKNKTNKILREVMRGKPGASLTPLSEEDLEDFILENFWTASSRGLGFRRPKRGKNHSPCLLHCPFIARPILKM
jgi:hypothetical protein